MAIAYNEAATPPVATKYVDGIFQDDWTANQGLDAARRALQPTAVLFGDGDQDERRIMWVDSIQIRSGALSKAELASLGAPAGEGIPVNLSLPTQPEIWHGAIGNKLVMNWPLDETGFVLETTDNLSTGTWVPVTGVNNNSATVTLGAGQHYYRLHK